MNQWYKLMRFFFYNALKNHPSRKINRSLVSLQNAKSIGVVYDGSKHENTLAVGKFVAELQAKNITVETLAFLPNEKSETPKAGTFSQKQIALNHLPKCETAEKFCTENFDILLALFMHETLPLEYVATTSKAKCRVGLYHPEKTNCFELMIQPSQGNNMSEWLHQAETLLNQIKQ